MAELKKCPFCGSEGKVIKGVGAMYMVVCNNENCSASVGLFKETPSEAIEAWNTRPTTTEAEIRASVIDEALKALSIFNDREHGNEHFIYGIETAKEILELLKEE